MKRKQVIAAAMSLMMALSSLTSFSYASEEVNESENDQILVTNEEEAELPDGSGEDKATVETTEEETGETTDPGENILTGLQEIDGQLYYFDEEGNMQTGVIEIDGLLYYFKVKDGAAKTEKGFFKCADGNTRYANGDGTIAQGIQTISGKGYYFYPDTGAKRTKAGWYDAEGKHFYVRYGCLLTGWNQKDDRAFYCYKSGDRMYDQAKDTTIGHLKIPESGFLGKAYALGVKKLNKSGWSLKKAYTNSYKMKYAHRWMRKKSSEAYAIYGFSNNKGNCYCMAATFYIQAKLLGYEVRQIEGKVNYRAPHSWTQIKQDGKWWVYDPNFRNETGRSGWKIYYGKKGTWRYTNYHVFQK